MSPLDNPNLKAIRAATKREMQRALTMRTPTEVAETIGCLTWVLMQSLAHGFVFAANGDRDRISQLLDASANRIAIEASSIILQVETEMTKLKAEGKWQ